MFGDLTLTSRFKLMNDLGPVFGTENKLDQILLRRQLFVFGE
jgi:hypothetical protein